MTQALTPTRIGALKILFDHPNPFFLAHGGFQIQIEQTKRALEKIGCEVEWLRWWDSDQRAQLIHYFGRPHPAYIRQCHAQGMRVIMSELLTGLGSRSALARFCQRWITKAARRFFPRDFTTRMSWDSYRWADRMIALTAWEKKLMCAQFDAPVSKIVVVPNGVEEVFLEKSAPVSRESHLIATMTITERKRAVELAEASALARVKIRILGAPYQGEDSYYRKFLAAVGKAGPWVDYVGGIVDRKQIAGEYRKAAGFVLLSSMESQSLSALEAAACGCPLLLSDLPWARASFGPEARYAPVASAARTAAYLRAFFEKIANAPRVRKVHSWQEVAGKLKDTYLEAITSR